MAKPLIMRYSSYKSFCLVRCGVIAFNFCFAHKKIPRRYRAWDLLRYVCDGMAFEFYWWRVKAGAV
ncbi:hypothetical protein Q4247_10335 [Acinetobacter baumannii]